MNTRIELNKATLENNILILEATETPTSLQDVEAKGQMLVDSDHLAFIYILESGDEFVYASLPDSIWPHLKEALDKEIKIELKLSNEQIELVNLIDELSYLLENIKDNANYGEEMENKVVEIFALA
ncbi:MULTISPECIES: hypothetical protein [Bacillaceae]|uniref:UPF0738 family protein n=1 Tax=Bacillaceae TaxID=186817 RepID=UPI000BFD23FD|nr:MULTISPECIES: hypothetical protein [Bacillaceae]MCM3160883.1 hypothetical protein [Metabacillus litoralis]MCM3411942.1 hypothetical protein [Metabacillus litoralis]PGT80689.1 hypothetical protein COD11_20290 [Bacillus sp. AFS040349]